MYDTTRLKQILEKRRQQGALRSLTLAPDGIDFTSNDYLGLAAHPDIAAAGARAYIQQGSGSKGSRLLGGNHPVFLATERKIAEWKGCEAALLFNCGYSANLGVLSALCDEQSHLYLDRLDHASMVDGYQLAGAKLHRFKHNDPADLERQLRQTPPDAFKMIAVESVYSMDGDLAPLTDYADLADRHGALLYIDEAHGEGVFGPEGKGLVHALGLEKRIDLTLSTFGKAYGCAGACVCGSQLLIDLLINQARSFIYSTALPPAAAVAISTAIDISIREDWRRPHVLGLAEHLRTRLQSIGFDTLGSQSPIVPVILGSNERALAASQHLAIHGLRVAAIRPPTVPKGSARLRINLTAAHTREQVDQLIEALAIFQTQNPVAP